MRQGFLIGSAAVLAAIVLGGLIWSPFWWLLVPALPVIGVGWFDALQYKHTLRRNFPLFGRGRWLMETIRPFVRQYLIESDIDGRPINRMFRSIVYQRAKGELDTNPYGTKVNTYRTGYEWIAHSLAAHDYKEVAEDPRVKVGGPDCTQPYSASILNISAMSFGALSDRAIEALNLGAKKGGFAHNTGEGCISPYHLKHGGDLIWQIGTGYFGARDSEGNFNEQAFAERACLPNVKMIEVKLSQGAKPGHGGILPASKNTPEIARIRLVPAGQDVISPSSHSAFRTPLEMMRFIGRLRELAEGKPVGFKLCIGRHSEFIAICKAMVETGITPDFITVDGGEGGTGAAPLEYSNSVGMPLRDAIAFVDDCLVGFGVRERIRIIASGKIFTGFHIVKNLSMGADMCNSARGMMLALGCVQSLVCNSNHCPTGVATQDRQLVQGLVVKDKAPRVAKWHDETVRSAMDIISSAGLYHAKELNRTHLHRRVSQERVLRYDEIYPHQQEGAFLKPPYPEAYDVYIREASAEYFQAPQPVKVVSNE